MFTLCLDLDNTLTNNDHRSHLVEGKKPDWERFLAPDLVAKDSVIPGAKEGVESLIKFCQDIFFITGRNENLRAATVGWLYKHFKMKPDKDHLLMRKVNDFRVPSVCKKDMLMKVCKYTPNDFKYFNYFICVDDDPYALKMYGELGCLTLKAPSCWSVLNLKFTDLPDETNWRK